MFFPAILLFLTIAIGFDFGFVKKIHAKLSHKNLVNEKLRIFVSKILLVVLAWLHVAWLSTFPEHYNIMFLTSAVMIFLMSNKRATSLMYLVNIDNSLAAFLMTFVLASGIMTMLNVDFLLLSMTFGFLLVFSFLFPKTDAADLANVFKDVNKYYDIIEEQYKKELTETNAKSEKEILKDEFQPASQRGKTKKKKHYHHRYPKENERGVTKKNKHNYTNIYNNKQKK